MMVLKMIFLFQGCILIFRGVHTRKLRISQNIPYRFQWYIYVYIPSDSPFFAVGLFTLPKTRSTKAPETLGQICPTRKGSSSSPRFSIFSFRGALKRHRVHFVFWVVCFPGLSSKPIRSNPLSSSDLESCFKRLGWWGTYTCVYIRTHVHACMWLWVVW